MAERVAMIDTAFAKTHETLMRNDVQAELGQQAVSLAAMTQNYFVPNLYNDVWEVPGNYAEGNHLPVIPVHWDERIRYGTSFMRFSPERRIKLTHEAKALSLQGASSLPEFVVAVEEELLKMPIPSEKISSPTKAEVVVLESSLIFESTKELHLNDDPILNIVIDEPPTPAVITHELLHKQQYDNESVIQGLSGYLPNDEKELRAYEVGAVIERAIDEVGIQSAINEMRHRYINLENPYHATRALRWHLRRKGLFTVANSLKKNA